MFSDANDFQENVCFSDVCLHFEKYSEKYFTMSVWRERKMKEMFFILFFIFLLKT
jgi:hypothetical protein